MLKTAAVLLSLLLASIPSPLEAEKVKRKVPAEMPEVYRVWLREVDVLISDDEWRKFVALTKDYQRDVFIRRFWEARDRDPSSPRNELREIFELRLALVRESFRDVTDARSHLLLINGSPTERSEIHCRGLTWPTEAWFYLNGVERRRTGFALIFFRPVGVGAWRLWDPTRDTVADLLDAVPRADQSRALRDLRDLDMTRVPLECEEPLKSLQKALEMIAMVVRADGRFQTTYPDLLRRLEKPIEPASDEWLVTFGAYSTDLPEATLPLTSELEFAFPGWQGQRTIVQGLLLVPASEAAVADLLGNSTYSFDLNGEVLNVAGSEKAETLHDAFRMRFDLPSGEAGEVLPLAFERYLRPGTYRLVLRLEDMNSHRMARHEVDLAVPKPVGPADFPAQMDPEVRSVLDAAYRAVVSGETSIEILRPQGEYLTGFQRFDTLVLGDAVDTVVFRLDGDERMRKKSPPFSVELDLGPLPTAHMLEATAYGNDGGVLVSDELMLNGSPHRFSVRLVEPLASRRYTGGLRARVEVTVPRGGAVERVEVYRGDERVATLYQPPYTHPIGLEGDAFALVRAVAFLADGSQTEDVVLVNSPSPVDEVDVDLVELYTTVVDGRKRPALGLTAADFRVLEDGVEQQVLRFEKVDDLPIHAVILLDTSASMNDRLAASRDAALDFFEQIVLPRDRVAAITFNDRPMVVAPFTAELKRFSNGLAGARAERSTALYDSLIYSLFYANGLEGQRAVLLISDGIDESSRFTFEQALEYLQRAGVTLYAIGLDLEGQGRRTLKSFADETGGRSFFLQDVSELPAVYDTIREELRTKYLLAYQSSNTSRRDRFRQVEVMVGKKGLEARTIRGYFP